MTTRGQGLQPAGWQPCKGVRTLRAGDRVRIKWARLDPVTGEASYPWREGVFVAAASSKMRSTDGCAVVDLSGGGRIEVRPGTVREAIEVWVDSEGRAAEEYARSVERARPGIGAPSQSTMAPEEDRARRLK